MGKHYCEGPVGGSLDRLFCCYTCSHILARFLLFWNFKFIDGCHMDSSALWDWELIHTTVWVIGDLKDMF